MTLILDEFDLADSLRKERMAIVALLVMIAGFMFFDIVDDWYEGSSLHHLVPEILIGTLGLGLAGLIVLRFSRTRHTALYAARDQLIEAKKIASEWQGKASSFRQGLSDAINNQLSKWQLTEAEREVSFLLLKGFSLQEIARLRETTEGTVRQQASLIYRKSGLSGRTQLSAFFLEDLLAPR